MDSTEFPTDFSQIQRVLRRGDMLSSQLFIQLFITLLRGITYKYT